MSGGAGRSGVRALPVAGWALLIFALSSIPGEALPPPPPFPGFDKVVHILLYGVLGLLAGYASAGRSVPVWLLWALCVLYGATDELHQIWVPYRQPDLLDLAADGVGAWIGLGGAWLLGWTGRRRGR